MNYLTLASAEDRPAWLAARTQGVTATDVARLVSGGTGTWSAIRAEKDGRGRDFRNAAMQHGNDREPVILKYAASAFRMEPCGLLLAAADQPLYLATPDAMSDTEVGEVKTTVHDWPTLDDAPRRYIDQILWQMRVTGLRRGRLIFEPHVDGIPVYPFPRDFTVEWDAARVEKLEATADEFFAYTGEPDEDAAELDALLSEYTDVDDVASAARKRADEIKARIEEHLAGQPRKFEGSLANLTRSADGVSKRFDQTAFKQADPATYKQFVTETPTKGRLTITRRAS